MTTAEERAAWRELARANWGAAEELATAVIRLLEEHDELRRGRSIIEGSHNHMYDELILAESCTKIAEERLASAHQRIEKLRAALTFYAEDDEHHHVIAIDALKADEAPHRLEQRAFIARKAEEMRYGPTKAETRLWAVLRPLGFLCQYPLLLPRLKHPRAFDAYILDYFEPGPQAAQPLAGGVAVEADGGSHKRRKGYDRRRDTRLASAGTLTLRYTNQEILDNLPTILSQIRRQVDAKGADAQR